MKITKEQFSKLNQIDRIEFRQREQKIKEYYECSTNSIPYMIIIMFVFITDIFLSLRTGRWIIPLKTHALLLELVLIFFLINFAYTLFNNIQEIKKLRELEEEYFKIELKDRRK